MKDVELVTTGPHQVKKTDKVISFIPSIPRGPIEGARYLDTTLGAPFVFHMNKWRKVTNRKG